MNEKWIQALGKMTYGIYVLTTFHKAEINGMIASWASQISYAPPLVMVAVHPNRYCHQLIEKSGYFALHVLAKNQKDFLKRFKGPDPRAKFSSLQWARGKTGCPILNECVAYLECEVKSGLNPGNHTLFIGEVTNAMAYSGDDQLSTRDYDGVYLGKS